MRGMLIRGSGKAPTFPVGEGAAGRRPLGIFRACNTLAPDPWCMGTSRILPVCFGCCQ